MSSTHVVWFKRDLRTVDNEALTRAAQQAHVICLYIYEPAVLNHPDYDARHLRFTNQCLAELDDRLSRLGGSLLIRFGPAVDVLNALYSECEFSTLHSHIETGNDVTYKRDLAVARWAKSMNVDWREYAQHGVFRRLKDRDGWSRRWLQQMRRPLFAEPESITFAQHGPSDGLKTAAELGLDGHRLIDPQQGGMSVAYETLHSFLTDRGSGYRFEMSSPNTAWSACSRISPHLAYGTISMREILQKTEARQARVRASRALNRTKGDPWLESLASFSKRLRWHCHFIQKLESQPDLEFQNMARVYDGMREPHFRDDFFDAWKAGLTGYPLVDACMRALRQTGWLNFRMRAMLVSFASYHLWLHWRPTAIFLAQQFVDYEPGIHYSQCQMQSGTTGINSVRIYSPIKQVADHDPDGQFIKRWVPELEAVPNEYIAEPDKMPATVQLSAGCVIGRDYPAPLVSHRAAVAAAKKRIYALRKTAGARAESKKVYVRHGSRRGPASRRRPS
ncbi:MAG: FAD-binding domain-containing protein [Myxococcota bacterium]|nr:FAD-binding domain-containing protein [Myxococcota bacterium]